MKTKQPKIIQSKISDLQIFNETISVYNDPKFAEMYFEKWRNDLPGIQLESFSRLVGTRGKILDVGCGPGHHANYLYKLGHDTCGIDLSGATLDIARTNFTGPKFKRLNMQKMPFTESEYAGIWACASIMHLPRAFLRSQLIEFKRVLAKGGLIALTLTVESQAHTDAFGRFFEFYEVENLFQNLTQLDFEVIDEDKRLLAKRTEQCKKTTEWITITARKKQ